ncbi:MAG: glycosyltransferase family 39 protein [Pirellulales bacterium]
MPSQSCPSLGRRAVVSAAVAVIVFLALLATSLRLPMVWDEGDAIVRADGIAHWASRFGDADPSGPFSRAAVGDDWEYTTVREGHPPLYGELIAGGRAAVGRWLPPLTAARFGPMLWFAVAMAVVFARLWHDESLGTALCALAALLTLPRLWAHSHFATLDGPLTACWLLAWATFRPEANEWRWRVIWGIALGLTLSAKFTGWLAPLPFVLCTVFSKRGDVRRTVIVGLPIALATFVLLNPPLWHAPVAGLCEFFERNLQRGAQPGLNVSTWFLGHMYNLDHPLPWYNTLFWTAVTVPLGTLLLAGVGMAELLRRRDAASALLLANWGVLLVVRATPWAPPHDGVRLFLPSFAFLAVIAGVGAGVIARWAQARWKSAHIEGTAGQASRGTRRSVAAWAIPALLLIGSATSVAWYTPQWISYYNLLCGGLPGAVRLGMEPTYFWDALDGETLDWLHAHTPTDEKIAFAAAPPDNLRLMRGWGTLQRDYRPDAPGGYRYYVLQRRPSAHHAVDRYLLEHAMPVWQKTIRPPQYGRGPWRLDVPLLDVYEYKDYEAAQAAVETETPR